MVRLIPKTIDAGATFRIRFELSRYPPSEWAAVLHLRGPSKIDVTGTDEAGVFLFEADTSEWKPGAYSYVLRLKRDGETLDVEKGGVSVNPNFENIEAGYDARGHVRKVLAAIEAVIEGRATSEQSSYKMGSLEIAKMDHEQLLLLRDRYKAELAALERSENGEFFTRRARVWL